MWVQDPPVKLHELHGKIKYPSADPLVTVLGMRETAESGDAEYDPDGILSGKCFRSRAIGKRKDGNRQRKA